MGYILPNLNLKIRVLKNLYFIVTVFFLKNKQFLMVKFIEFQRHFTAKLSFIYKFK